jgi:hypothetical protein
LLAGYPRLHTINLDVSYCLLFNGSSGEANAPSCYVYTYIAHLVKYIKNDYNRYINAQKAGILIKVPGLYVDYNTSVQWRVWAEISLLATYFRQAVMATHSLLLLLLRQ